MNKTLLLTSVILLLICTTGCADKAKAKYEETNNKVNTYKVSSQEIQTFIETTGNIQVDLEGGAKIISPLGGVVDNIFVKVGERVSKGKALLSVKSSDVSDTYVNYLSNVLQVKQSERNYNLNRDLFKVGAVTKNDLINSETNYEQLKVVEEGFKKKLDMYGINPEDTKNLQDLLVIKAPMSGVVVDIQAHKGDRIDTSAPLMVVADPGKVLVVANIYDTDIKNIQKGNEVVFYTDVFPDRTFRGVVNYVSDVEDPDTKTIKTYIKVIDEAKLFKQNMFLKIRIAERKRFCQTIPKTAMIYKDGEFYVYIKDQQDYALRRIRPLWEDEGKMMAVEGLKDSDEVVLSALDLEKQ